AERELELLRPQEVAMKRVVAVDAHAAVEVLRRVHDPLSAVGRPELGNGNLGARRQPLAESPHGLPRGETDGFGVDVRVGSTLSDSLERCDRTVELLPRLRVLRGHAQRFFADA